MVKKGGLKEPRKFFSTLHYKGQERRIEPPTEEEQQQLESLKTDYEGKRYQVPEDMSKVVHTDSIFSQIEDRFKRKVVGKEDENLWKREFAVKDKGNDYDFRFWYQYEIENMASGKRSMRFLKDQSSEYQTAMRTLCSLSMKVSKVLRSMCEDAMKSDRADNISPISHLIEINEKIKNDELSLDYAQIIFLPFEKQFYGRKIKHDLHEYINENPLFYHLAKETLIVFFKSIRPTEKFRYMKKSELIEELNGFDFHDVDGKTNRELVKEIKSILKNKTDPVLRKKYFQIKYVCETNSLFRKLYRSLGKAFARWVNSYFSTGGPSRKNALFIAMQDFKDEKKTETLIRGNNIHNMSKEYRNICVKLATACLFSLNSSDMVNLAPAEIYELDSLYEEDYEHAGTSYPNVIRMSNSLLKKLEMGNHPIIRHFQLDEKRNMYCLPRVHTPFEMGSRGKGGFLHNDCKTVSLHHSLLNLIDQNSLDFSRIKLSNNSLNALNFLQQTQWSINLDFLDFIGDLTFKNEIVSPYPSDIRQMAWYQTDSIRLREIFIEKMEFKSEDISTKSRFRTVNSNLKQARKNLLYSCNVFWHPWFCDWRGRFNTRVNELSPQGDDLSKALLLFTEWKELGARGKHWVYVRAYDLLHKIIEPDEVKKHIFDEQESWVKQHLDDILTMGEKLNRSTSNDELEPILDRLKVIKPGRKSEIFQRIAFLIEFVRIHREYESNNQDWSKVKSGLPIHLDASCNGFQHIAALTRNEKLAKSVNLLNNKYMAKGDLYQEVAYEALSAYQENSGQSSSLRKVIDKICQTEESKDNLISGLLTRGFCKPLVMITGYGAKDLASQIMNMNGKKKCGGRYKPKKGKKSDTTVHLESLLYEQVKTIHEKHGGLEKIILNEDKSGYLVPIENCALIKDLGLKLADYIRFCIEEVTKNKFGDVKEILVKIYEKIDTSIGVDIDELHKLKYSELTKILAELNLPKPPKKADRVKKIRQHVAEKYKRLLYFTWQASEEGSIVTYLKWKLDHNRTQATLPMSLLPKNYQDPGEQEIEKFLLDSPTLSKDLKDLIRESQGNVEKNATNNSNTKRRLKELVIIGLRTIAIISKDKKEQTTAKNHSYARFIELRGKRTSNGKKNGHRITVESGNQMKLNVSSTKEFNETISEMRELSKEIILGMVPNFIHSFDAVHMQKVILSLEKEGIKDFWAVHDSFGVHACHIDELRRIVKQTFVDLHKEPLEHHLKKIIDLNSDILSADFLANSADFLANYKEQNISPKNEGKMRINDVLKAEFLIS